jgi:hypothetical protein
LRRRPAAIIGSAAGGCREDLGPARDVIGSSSAIISIAQHASPNVTSLIDGRALDHATLVVGRNFALGDPKPPSSSLRLGGVAPYVAQSGAPAPRT